MKRGSLLAIAISIAMLVPSGPARASGIWTWPVVGPIVRGFDPPNSPYGSGHRGIDIGVPVGTPVLAPAAGVVTFAGSVAGRLFVTIDHGGGLLSTSSFLAAVLVRKGDTVTQGEVVALSGTGHAGDVAPDVHVGVRLAGAYVDPLDYLGPMDVTDLIRLAPVLAPVT
jgi:murein DD-endopeptidase MepM/ murein hydrolase activator NlpD